MDGVTHWENQLPSDSAATTEVENSLLHDVPDDYMPTQRLVGYGQHHERQQRHHETQERYHQLPSQAYGQLIKYPPPQLRTFRRHPQSPQWETSQSFGGIDSSSTALTPDAMRLREKVLEASERTLGEEHPGTLTSMGNLAASYSDLDRGQEATEMREEAMEMRTRMPGEEHPNTLTSMGNLATNYSDLGRKQEAMKLWEESLEANERTLGKEHPNTLDFMDNLAASCSDLGRRQEAMEMRKKVLEARERILGEEHPDTLASMDNLAACYSDLGRMWEAMEMRKKVLEAKERKLGKEHYDTLTSMDNLAASYSDLDRKQEAMEMREKVLEVRKRILGEEHPGTLTSMDNLAASYSDLGRKREAMEMRKKVLEARKKVLEARKKVLEARKKVLEARERILGKKHPNTLTSMDSLAASYSNFGRMWEAMEMREKVLEARKRTLGEEHPDTLTSMDNLAASYSDLGRMWEGMELTETLELEEVMLGKEHPKTLASMDNLAASYSDLGRKREAMEMRKKVPKVRERMLGEEHFDTLTSMDNLAASYSDLGRMWDAMESKKKVLEAKERMLGKEHPDTLTLMGNLAASYSDLVRKQEAMRLWERVLGARKKALGEEQPGTLTSMDSLASSYSDIGRRQEAYGMQGSSEYTSPSRNNDNTDTVHPKLVAQIIATPPTLGEGDSGPSYIIQKHPHKFFVFGRVFSAIWTEPASGSDSGTEYTRVEFGEYIYSNIRRFVVVKESYNSCLCLPIRSHSKGGAPKASVNPIDYAIVYTGHKPPEQNDEELLIKKPLCVIPDAPGRKLDSTSRINFGKIYTVDHNIKVSEIGKVAEESEHLLDTYYKQTHDLHGDLTTTPGWRKQSQSANTKPPHMHQATKPGFDKPLAPTTPHPQVQEMSPIRQALEDTIRRSQSPLVDEEAIELDPPYQLCRLTNPEIPAPYSSALTRMAEGVITSPQYELFLAASPGGPAIPPNTPGRPAEQLADFGSPPASRDHETMSARSYSTCDTSFGDSVGASEELVDGDEDIADDDMLPPDIDPDDRLVNPRSHFQKLRDLEASVYQQSAARFYGAATIGHDDIGDSSTSNFQLFVPFLMNGVKSKVREELRPHKHSEHVPREPLSTDLLLHLLDCRNLLSNTVANLKHLRCNGFGGDCFNLLTIAKGRPEVANLVSLDTSLVERLAQEFSRAMSDLASTESKELHTTAPVLKLNKACEQVLDLLGLLDSRFAAYQGTDPEILWRRVVHTLDLAVLSYSGAHVSRFDESYLGVTKDCFEITGPFLALQSQPHSIEQQVHGITMRRRSLRCLDGFLRGKQVWVFHPEPQGHTSNLPNDKNHRLYLLTRVITLASIWGPLWATSSKNKPEEILEYSLGNGSIVTWPIEPNEEQYVRSGETFVHWISSQENCDIEAARKGMVSRHFVGTETLLIGGGTGRTPRLRSNPDCVGTERSFKERYKNSGCLHHTGTVKPTRNLDMQTMQVQGGGMGLAGTVGITYKIDNGQTWKEALVERWEKEPDRRNPRVLEHWFGVEVSACTENARRRRLVSILATQTMKDYLKAVGFPWGDEECERRYYQSLLSERPSAFRELYHAHLEWRSDLARAVAMCLQALRETGIDDNGMLSAFWVTEPDDEWIVTLRKSEHTWVGLLRDTTESGTMAIIVDKCLEFDNRSSRCCLSRSENGNARHTPEGFSVLETAIAVNELVKPPELAKPRNSDTEAGKRKKWSWDVSRLRRGCDFQIGDAEGKKGELTLLRDPGRDGTLFMEWKTSINPIRGIKRKFNEELLGKEAGRYHQEYIRDGKWEFDKIVIYVVSKSEHAWVWGI